MSSLQEIINLLNQQRIIGQSGIVSFKFANVEVPLGTKDIVGSVLQEWFANWMTNNGISYKGGIHTQNWPDFILADGTDLEVKAFDGNQSPNFDLANFDTYIRSLITEPERLDTDHLIFEYTSSDYKIKLTNFYIKKIWQMTGASSTNILNVQKKQDIIYNIRPKNWRSPKVQTFNSRLEFVQCIRDVLEDYKSLDDANEWYNNVSLAYHSKTGYVL